MPGTIAASAHQSHSYPDGACLYFTFAGQVEADERTAYHRALWDAGQRAALAAGAALSHHHGVGLARSRYVAEALGPAFDVLVATKAALDPNGILNPGKLGLPSPWGAGRLVSSTPSPSAPARRHMAVGVPVAAVGSLVLDDGSDLVFLFAVLAVAGFVAGGYVAGRAPPTRRWPTAPSPPSPASPSPRPSPPCSRSSATRT